MEYRYFATRHIGHITNGSIIDSEATNVINGWRWYTNWAFGLAPGASLGIWNCPWYRISICAGHGMSLTDCVFDFSDQQVDKSRKVFTTWVLKRYNNELQTSEMFSTAGRTVKSGLVASAVVSSWTWAATLLQSSSVAFRYGTALMYIRLKSQGLIISRCIGASLVCRWRYCADIAICYGRDRA